MMKKRANIITQRKHIMNTRETLILKALNARSCTTVQTTTGLSMLCSTKTLKWLKP